MTDAPPEFAPEYDTVTKWRIVSVGVLAVAVLWACSRLWLRPWFEAFVQQAPCHQLFGMNAAAAMFYAIFIGMPLICGVVIAASLGRVGVQALRAGAMPPPGMKVLRRTRIVRGAQARLRALAMLALTLACPAMAVWGYFQAQHLAAMAEAYGAHPAVQKKCAADAAVRPN